MTPLPPALIAMLERREREGWAGTIALHVKDGHVIAYDVTEKTRVASERGQA